MKLWEGLEQDLNYNAMVSQRGVLNLYPHRRAARRLCAARQRDAAARRRRRAARRGGGARDAAVSRFRQCALPDQGRAAAAARRHGAARRRGLGLCARRRPSAASTSLQNCEVTGIDATAAGSRRRDHARLDRRRQGRRWRSPGNTSRAGRDGRAAPADRKPRAAGVRVRGDQAADRRRRDLRRRAFLYQPVRQGRAGVRRRYRRLQLLCPARQPADGRGRLRGRHGADADARAAARAARVGRHHGHVDGRLADHRPDADRRASISTPAGATAASRRRRRRAGASPIRSRDDEPHAVPPPIGSTASRAGHSSTRKGAALSRIFIDPRDALSNSYPQGSGRSMLIPCPYCGERDLSEFVISARPIARPERAGGPTGRTSARAIPTSICATIRRALHRGALVSRVRLPELAEGRRATPAPTRSSQVERYGEPLDTAASRS